MWLRLLTFYFRSPKGSQKIFLGSSLGSTLKGVPFSDFKYMRGLEFHSYEKVGSVILVGKKVPKGLTDALHGCEKS